MVLKVEKNVGMGLKVDRTREFNKYGVIVDELDDRLWDVDDRWYERFGNEVVGGDRIFVGGKGGCGFVGNSFGMGLKEVGEEGYVVGEWRSG